MSLPHAILGFLQAMPMTGYDLKTQAFDRTVAHFWSAAQQQIYRELDKMDGFGWVRCEVELQTDRPPRKVYHITDAGKAELASWLRQPQPLMQHREAFLIQLFFAAQLTNAEIIELLNDQLAGHRARLADLERIAIPPTDDPAYLRRQTLTRLTLDLGLRLEQMYIDWLTAALHTVRQMPEG
ncbi:MAG: PadR family transcriptional regulator [Chloroflexi bacterium]|nr:PadR family transcriptional regulator [Chloroflexota bacterium]